MAKKAPKVKPAEAPAPSFNTEQLPVVYLAPEVIRLDPTSNVRFGLKRHTLDSLKADILSVGQVETAIDVEVLPDGEGDGCKYVVRRGNRRVMAAREINAETHAGMLVPAIVRTYANPLQRLLRQIAENKERENLSLMDIAITIRRLDEEKVPRVEIRNIFSRPTGKKLKMEPASNSWIAKVLFLLTLPKKIQTAVDEGRMGLKAVDELRRHPADKWEAIYQECEDRRLKEMDKEATEETRFLNALKKDETAETKATETATKLAAAKELVESTGQAESAAVQSLKSAFDAKVAITGTKADKEAKKLAEETFKAADNTAKAAKEAYANAKKDLDKIEAGIKKAADLAESRKAQLAAARANQSPITPGEVQTSATTVAQGASSKGEVECTCSADMYSCKSTGHIPLNKQQQRFYCESILKLAGTGQSKTSTIGKALIAAFDGKLTDGQLYMVVCKAVGEWREPAKKTA